MTAQKTEQMETPAEYMLKKTLGAFDLGFMQPRLQKVPDAAALLSGVYGRILMAQWKIDRKNGADPLAMGESALKALEVLAELKSAFDRAFDATDSKKPILRRLIEAYYEALRASPPGPFEYRFGSNPHATLLEKKIDCDLASLMLIQFAESKGCRLVGAHVTTPSGEAHFAAVAIGLDGKPSLFIDTVLLIPTPKLPNTAKVREFVLQKTLRTPEEFEAFYKDVQIVDPRDGSTGWEIINRMEKILENMKKKSGTGGKKASQYGTGYLHDLDALVTESEKGGEAAARTLFDKKRAEYARGYEENADFKSYYLYVKFMLNVQDFFVDFVNDEEMFKLHMEGVQRFGKEKVDDLFGR